MSGSKSNKSVNIKNENVNRKGYVYKGQDEKINVGHEKNPGLKHDLFNYAPVALLVLDENGKILELNKTAKKFFATNDDPLKNRLLLSLIHKDDKIKFNNHLNTTFQGRKSNSCTVQLTNLLGESFRVFIKSERYFDGAAYYVRLAIMEYPEKAGNDMVVRDTINKLNYIKDQLFKTQNFYEEILDNFPDGIFICDENSDVIYANRYIKKKYGNVLGIKCYDTFFEHSGRCSWCKGINEKNERIVFEDETEKTLFLAHYPLKDKDGKDLQLSFLKDITDNILNERNLNERYAFIKFISGVSSKLIDSRKDLKHQSNSLLQFITKHVNAHCGYLYYSNDKKDQLELKNIWPSNNKRKRFRVLQKQKFPELFMKKAMNNIHIWEGEALENYFVAPNDERLNVKGMVTVPLIVENIFLGYLGLDFKENIDSLDEMIADELLLTAQIISNSIERKKAIDTLVLAKEKAEESDRLKSVFLSNMSHEIRTPMNGILGFTEILARMEVNKEKQKRYINIIQQSTKQLLTIIDDIVDISKIESGQFEVFNSRIELNSFCQEIYERHNEQLKKKRINSFKLILKKAVEKESIFCETDEVMLKRILNNLIGNATKFTNKGSIEFGYEFLNDQTLLFYVKDTGIGIRPEQQKVIFERFRQIDEGETREYGGTGLGLSITKSFVEGLGGHIWIESEPKKGSTFYFTIPFIGNEKHSHTAKESFEINLNNAWKGKKILIVDDNEDVHYYFQESFEETNASFFNALNGQEGIEKYKEVNPDIVLMDIQMPVMDGFETCSRIKSLNDKTPVIMQTAYNSKKDFIHAKNVGANCLITKPIDKGKTFKIISGLLFENS